MPGSTVTGDHIRAAAGRIAPYVHRTPVLSSRLINAEAGCDILFKCENLQKVGAFKARGAHNAVLCLSREQLARGVATHSSGNHAAALCGKKSNVPRRRLHRRRFLRRRVVCGARD